MHMGMVGMGGDHGLETISHKAAGKLHSDLLRLLRGDFAGGKGVDHMIALYGAACLVPAAFSLHHFPESGFRLTVDPANKNCPGGGSPFKAFGIDLSWTSEGLVKPCLDKDLIIPSDKLIPLNDIIFPAPNYTRKIVNVVL